MPRNDDQHSQVPPEPTGPVEEPVASAPPEQEHHDFAGESWLTVIRHGVAGTGGDPTSGPVGRAVVLLAIPMVLEMVMESIFAVVDIFFVSRLGDEAMAGVGLTESILTIIFTIAMGLSIGVTATVARRIGERNPDGAARAAVQAILLGAFVSLVFGISGVIWADELLRLMGADDAIVAASLPYTQIMLGGNVVILLLFLQNAAFRGAGDAAIAMRVLWIANALNIVLDPILIFGLGPIPAFGIQGAAIATTIGRGTAVVIQLYTLLKLGRNLRVARDHLGIDFSIMARLVKLSATGTLQVFVGMASWIGLVRVTASFGAEALAGYVIAMRIVMFALLPAWGLSNAASTMVGQGLGARDPDRAERAVWIACRFNLYFLGAVGVAFLAFAPFIVGLFGGTDQAGEYGVHALRIVALGFPFYAYGMVLSASFNGAGDAWTPTIINFFCFWLWELPLAWILAMPVGLGANGVFIAIMVAFSTLAVVSAVVFRKGKWRDVSV